MIKRTVFPNAGFQLVCKNDYFKCAFITQSDQYSFGKVSVIKRHNASDEVFVLIKGSAVLLTADAQLAHTEVTRLEPSTSYCVEAGTWHYLAVSNDGMVFVTENGEVSAENTQAQNVEALELHLEEPYEVFSGISTEG